MDVKFEIVITLLAVASLFALAGLVQQEPIATPMEFKEIPRFESYDALEAAFAKARDSGRGYGIFEDSILTTTAAQKSAAPAAEAGGLNGATDYSKTNVQVEGVDEADIVKTDGKYIYAFSKNKLIITDAYPIESAAIISKTELENTSPIEMFIEGNKLLVFGNKRIDYEATPTRPEIGMAESMIAPYPYYGSRIAVQLYNISDPTSPVLEKEIEFEGNYLTSRLIGSNAYFVVNAWPRYEVCKGNEPCLIPLMIEDGVERLIAEPTDIGYLPPMPVESFVTIASINLESKELQKETIAGSANSVFASADNIYLAGTNWSFPEIPVIREPARMIMGDFESTVVNKFGLDKGEIGFLGQGSVPGHILNQFSMDEFEGNFRIATTIGRNGSNSVYVLNKEMESIGSLENIAPGESIFSARFMGAKAYLVTFRKTDPLFVIDLSEPANPKVLGKLKIPGYSDYLHPIDETHLIGLGKEAVEAAKGDFAWYQGLKLAIFDVSDVENPIEMHTIEIGDRGTESYALRDHKAFLFDREKELLVIPITLAEIPEEQKKPLDEEQQWPSYGEYTFQGAFVFNVTLENGFTERGRITHATAEDELKRGYYYGGSYSVKRALYIGDVLYTLSETALKANSLSTLEELKRFAFE